MAKQVRARPLLAYVAALAFATTLPPLLLAVVTTTRWVSSEQARLRTATGEMTDHARSQVDRYIAGKIAMLQALATSPAWDVADFRRLDEQARELLDLQGANIVARDVNGQQLFNTRVPWGTPLPRVPNLAADENVVRSKSPFVSDLYVGTMAGRPLVRMVAPVIRGGRVIYTITASIPPQALSGLLREAGIVEPYFGSIADRDGVILARAVHDDALVGKPLPGFARATGDSGTWSGVNPSGIHVYANYRRSDVSGWLFAVGVDSAVLDAPLYRSLWLLGGLAVALALLAFLASSLLARRILTSQRQVADAAEAVGDGHVVDAPRTAIRETNLVGDALAATSIRLRDQADALVAANRHLERRVAERTREVSAQADLIQVTLDNMDQGLMLIEADGTVPVCNQRARQLLDLPASLFEGRPTFAAIRRYQLDQGDFERSDQSLKHWVEASGVETGQHTYERERPNGLVLEIRTVPLASGGAVRTYTDVTARKRVERLSHHMARHDPLTELPNRVHVRERLAQELAAADWRGGSFAVLCLDLDRFKAVNDTLGHPAGDALLRLVADRLRGVVQAEDSVARLGGDEFALIQVGGDQPHAARSLAGRIVEAIREPFDLEGHVITIGISIGIAVAPHDGHDADRLFKSADLALYRAKDEGRNGCRFYDASMDVAVQAREAPEPGLRDAVARGRRARAA